MNTKVNKAYFLIPVLYTALIIFLLYMQFSGTKSFSSEIQDISIRGKTHSGAPGTGSIISDLSVSSNGLQFSFGEENPLLVFTQDGLTHRVRPEDYRVTASGIDIRLAKNILVSFYHVQNDTNTLHISLNAGDPESIKYISLPVTGTEAVLEKMGSVPVVSVKSETLGNFYLNLPETAEYSPEEESVIIYPDASIPTELVLEKTAGSGLDAFSFWVGTNADLISEEELDIKIRNYIDMSAAELTDGRLNSTRGTWATGTGSSEFYENALVMATVENIGKSSYRRTLDLMNRAATNHSRDLTLMSSPLFGNIVNECWSYDEGLGRTVDRLEDMAESGNYSVFSEPDLLTAVITEDSGNLVPELKSMTESFPEQGLSLVQSLAMLEFYSALTETFQETAVQFEGAIDSINDFILPSVKVLGNRIYIADNEGNADIYLTLRAGLLLRKFQRIEKIDDIGRELVYSALLLSDSSGYLPASAYFTESGEAVKKGIIRPETIYPLFDHSPYYPGFDYYLSDTGEKLAVLNQADDFRIENTDFGYRLTFNFPAGQTHSFAVRNLNPFYQIHLLGYKWNSDHRFLTYSSGWWYDNQHNTLFIKIRHRAEKEEVLIYTERPPEPPAPVETEQAETTAVEPETPQEDGQGASGDGL